MISVSSGGEYVVFSLSLYVNNNQSCVQKFETHSNHIFVCKCILEQVEVVFIFAIFPRSSIMSIKKNG